MLPLPPALLRIEARAGGRGSGRSIGGLGGGVALLRRGPFRRPRPQAGFGRQGLLHNHDVALFQAGDDLDQPSVIEAHLDFAQLPSPFGRQPHRRARVLHLHGLDRHDQHALEFLNDDLGFAAHAGLIARLAPADVDFDQILLHLAHEVRAVREHADLAHHPLDDLPGQGVQRDEGRLAEPDFLNHGFMHARLDDPGCEIRQIDKPLAGTHRRPDLQHAVGLAEPAPVLVVNDQAVLRGFDDRPIQLLLQIFGRDPLQFGSLPGRVQRRFARPDVPLARQPDLFQMPVGLDHGRLQDGQLPRIGELLQKLQIFLGLLHLDVALLDGEFVGVQVVLGDVRLLVETLGPFQPIHRPLALFFGDEGRGFLVSLLLLKIPLDVLLQVDPGDRKFVLRRLNVRLELALGDRQVPLGLLDALLGFRQRDLLLQIALGQLRIVQLEDRLPLRNGQPLRRDPGDLERPIGLVAHRRHVLRFELAGGQRRNRQVVPLDRPPDDSPLGRRAFFTPGQRGSPPGQVAPYEAGQGQNCHAHLDNDAGSARLNLLGHRTRS